ncbi:HD domain-containing phosphohydrolase [Desulfosarcina ovata]|uniref:HD-GYP domain-containing protein n=1 Tax=Desulfosarcina ovata subsp. ovata TaxID=2752305 RepID=A0A5K8A5W9_9BACT|nr:HD domain-containing phosphohydrolase [Desulfosarcina ovata]BBO87856.1 hypothetical protein DSCOOX_10360 [Desulfosarcina ovata subsp. ovata]
MPFSKKKYPFYIGITTLVVVIVLTLSGFFLGISHHESKTAAMQMADRLFSEINAKTMQRYESVIASVAVLVGSASHMPAMATAPTGSGLSHPGIAMMLRALTLNDYLFSSYVGYDDGSFIQVVGVGKREEFRRYFGAPPETAYVLRIIAPDADGTLIQRWHFLDPHHHRIGVRDDLDPGYDPRGRPWYTRAQLEDAAFYTAPYIFSSTRLPGITCAERLGSGKGVFGADITLERFTQSLARQRVSENGMLFLFDRRGRLIAHSHESAVQTSRDDSLRFLPGAESDDPLVRSVVAGYLSDPDQMGDRTREAEIGGSMYLVRTTRLKAKLKFDQVLAVIAPVADFTGHIRQMQQRIFFFSGLTLLAFLPVVLFVSRKISGSLILLELESMKIRRFDFTPSAPFDSNIKEIHSLIQAFVLMKSTIRTRTDALIATQGKLKSLVDSGISLTAEKNMDQLLRHTFKRARELSRTDGGILYLRNASNQLELRILENASGPLAHPNGINVSDPAAPAPPPGDTSKTAGWVAATAKTIVANRMNEQSIDRAEADCHNLLTVPLSTREGVTLGVLQLFNARDDQGKKIVPFDKEIVGFVEALTAQAAVALHNKHLMEEQRALFDAFIQMIAGAIDAKSPYTGNHCARVPEVAEMLARAAHQTPTGPFADFRMQTQDQWREFRVAAWLHDCGKVTTPEYIVDKATKLETICNRIHEIRMRFEVLLRDAEITSYRQRLAGNGNKAEIEEQLQASRRQIMEDFAFVADCNMGGESMADEDIARLQQIGAQTWVRHLDDRIGISQKESALKRRHPAAGLPAIEPILADKPEHVIPRPLPNTQEKETMGIVMQIPANETNLGELYNLSIPRGTLTTEDRFKIQAHIIETIRMLDRLPFPDYLANVADYAGAHHETMIGTGYPRGLKKEQISIPARIMAIADIFEALTATDRPYKEPKTLSQALGIMRRMRDEQHIDADLFDLFLTEGIYRTYAQRFMDPHQIDAVDIRQYLSQGAP